jgi:hypothetical protein
LLDEHSAYFRARAEDEILAAECADHPEAARAHFLLAGYYLDLAYNPAARATKPAPVEGSVVSRRPPPPVARDLDTHYAEA